MFEKLIPMFNNILVKRDKEIKTTDFLNNKILLSKATINQITWDKQQQLETEGIVFAVGHTCTTIKPNDRVYWGKFTGSIVKRQYLEKNEIQEDVYMLMQESDILLKIENIEEEKKEKLGETNG